MRLPCCRGMVRVRRNAVAASLLGGVHGGVGAKSSAEIGNVVKVITFVPQPLGDRHDRLAGVDTYLVPMIKGQGPAPPRRVQQSQCNWGQSRASAGRPDRPL